MLVDLCRLSCGRYGVCIPMGPRAQTVYTLGLTYLYRDYYNAIVYIKWVHGPWEYGFRKVLLPTRMKGF